MKHLTESRPGLFTATPEAAETIAHIEAEVTLWYAGRFIHLPDLIDRALSLTGLMITVDSTDDIACIQARV